MHLREPMWNHWTVRTHSPHHPFDDFFCAQKTWRRFKEVFPEMIAGVLMPNHIHLILPGNTHNERRRLAGILSGISREFGTRWQEIPPPTALANQLTLERNLRYVALNPCRKKLCADPLEWWWSSYREVIGASVGTEDSAKGFAHILRRNPRTVRVWFHEYVSGDPSVNVAGTPFPKPASPGPLVAYPLQQILAAACAAHRDSLNSVSRPGPTRDLFVHLAYRYGWKGQRQPIAQLCHITPRAVNFIYQDRTPLGLLAAELCLGDPRLRAPLTQTQPRDKSFPPEGKISF